MLRRCMTPNPNSNNKALCEIVDGFQGLKKGNRFINKINYDSFFYVDRLTNKKVAIGEMKEDYEQKTTQKAKDHKKKSNENSTPRETKPGQSAHDSKTRNSASKAQKQSKQNRQIEEVNDCLMLMKTTKLFEMSNLKNKLFSKTNESQEKGNGQIDGMIKKKKQIREFIENYIKNISISEFRRYMEPAIGDKIKLINQNVLNLSKYMSNVITKNNIEKIIQEFLLTENSQPKKRSPIIISIHDIVFEDEQRLKQLLFNHVFIRHKDFEHLIHPSQKKQIFRRIYSQAKQKNSFVCNFKYESDVDSYNFEEFSEERKKFFQEKPCPPKESAKMQLKKKELILAIQNGLIYDFLFLVIRWPQLLQFKDKKGNNLLHIAAKTNQIEMYNILIKKMGVQALKHKNNFGRTPKEIAKLFCSNDIVDRNKDFQGYFD